MTATTTTKTLQAQSPLLDLAVSIQQQATELVLRLQAAEISQPSLEVGASSQLWTEPSEPIARLRTSIIDNARDLEKLLLGPSGFLHEFISSNWDLGALYTILEFDILSMIPINGSATVQELAQKANLPQDKLLRILRLSTCEGILNECAEESFKHTAISQSLQQDDKFRAFIGFQLFETRVASSHLADSLKLKENDYSTGQSAFEYAWGKPMYEWFKTHPGNLTRFQNAMEGVNQSLDTGNILFYEWFHANSTAKKRHVIDIGGGTGYISKYLATQFPQLGFQVEDSATHLLDIGRKELSAELQDRVKFEPRAASDLRPDGEATSALAYILRGVFWNKSDEQAVKVLKALVPILQQSPETTLLVSDGISPTYGSMDSHVAHPYRRRDLTVMTMHNARQRTEQQWAALFKKAHDQLDFTLTTAYSAHTYRGLWAVKLTPTSEGSVSNGHVNGHANGHSNGSAE